MLMTSFVVEVTLSVSTVSDVNQTSDLHRARLVFLSPGFVTSSQFRFDLHLNLKLI